MPKANEHLVVVGGTSGIGLSLARAAHAIGCKLTVTGRGTERTAETAKSIGPGVVGRNLDLEGGARHRPPSPLAPLPSGHHRKGLQCWRGQQIVTHQVDWVHQGR
jgi:NAD(P)-dependent dehydrogenase (short-subunit alcohol dehydrogenase family)